MFNKGTIAFLVIYAVSTFNFLAGEILHPVPEAWHKQFEKNCEGVPTDKRSPELFNFMQFNLAIALAFAYFGLIFEHKCLETRKYTRQ
jgi:hypothetical protein